MGRRDSAVNVTFRPIEEWPTPGGRRSPEKRQRSRFEAHWSATLELLRYELGRLGADAVVIRLDLTDKDIRLDGWPRANSRPGHPGVVVEWQIGEAWYGRANDLYDDWHSNARVIALTLEALRAVERWGAVSGEQYEGMRLEIEAPRSGALEAKRILAHHAGVISDIWEDMDIKIVYRMAVQNTHPDAGGSAEAFNEVQDAWRVLGGGR